MISGASWMVRFGFAETVWIFTVIITARSRREIVRLLFKMFGQNPSLTLIEIATVIAEVLHQKRPVISAF